MALSKFLKLVERFPLTRYPSCDVAQGLDIDHDAICKIIKALLQYWEGTEYGAALKRIFQKGHLETCSGSIPVYFIRIDALEILISHLQLNFQKCNTDEWFERADAFLKSHLIDQMLAAKAPNQTFLVEITTGR